MVQGWIVNRRAAWVQWRDRQRESSLWSSGNFRRFYLGETTRAVGHHFFAIALPWLVMETTGSATAMGTTIALMGVSRLMFTLVGGTLLDRFSPRLIMRIAVLVRAALIGLLACFVLLGRADSLVIFSAAFGVGLTDAILFPVSSVMLTRLLREEQLKSGNAMLTATGQFWGLVGPLAAGIAITWLDSAAWLPVYGGPGAKGASVAFLINFFGLVSTAALLGQVRLLPRATAHEHEKEQVEQNTSLKSVLRYLLTQPELRAAFIMVYGINIISAAPLWLGLPILAITRFPHGAQALGLLTSALGGGAMLGSALAGLLPRPHRMGRACLGFTGGVLLGLAVLNAAWSPLLAAAAVLSVAMMVSYVTVIGVTHIQHETPPTYLGRVMSLLHLK